MTTVTKQRIRRNRALPREELRERVFLAALELFRETGYDAATIELVARRAGVAKGTVFNFFDSKGAILLAHYAQLEARFGAVLTQASPARPLAALVDAFGQIEKMLRREGVIVDAILREVAVDATLYRVNQVSNRQDRERLATFFRACQDRGTVAASVDPVAAAQVVADLWSGTAQDWVRTGRRYSLQRSLADKLELVFAGLAPPKGRRGR